MLHGGVFSVQPPRRLSSGQAPYVVVTSPLLPEHLGYRQLVDQREDSSSPSSVCVDLSTLAPNTRLYTNRLSYSRMTSALSNILSLTSWLYVADKCERRKDVMRCKTGVMKGWRGVRR